MIPYFTILVLFVIILVTGIRPETWQDMPWPIMLVSCIGAVMLMLADLVRYQAIMQTHKQYILEDLKKEKKN